MLPNLQPSNIAKSLGKIYKQTFKSHSQNRNDYILHTDLRIVYTSLFSEWGVLLYNPKYFCVGDNLFWQTIFID